jgi:hypothetical protein
MSKIDIREDHSFKRKVFKTFSILFKLGISPTRRAGYGPTTLRFSRLPYSALPSGDFLSVERKMVVQIDGYLNTFGCPSVVPTETMERLFHGGSIWYSLVESYDVLHSRLKAVQAEQARDEPVDSTTVVEEGIPGITLDSQNMGVDRLVLTVNRNLDILVPPLKSGALVQPLDEDDHRHYGRHPGESGDPYDRGSIFGRYVKYGGSIKSIGPWAWKVASKLGMPPRHSIDDRRYVAYAEANQSRLSLNSKREIYRLKKLDGMTPSMDTQKYRDLAPLVTCERELMPRIVRASATLLHWRARHYQRYVDGNGSSVPVGERFAPLGVQFLLNVCIHRMTVYGLRPELPMMFVPNIIVTKSFREALIGERNARREKASRGRPTTNPTDR